jgi:hypothetical protein
VKKFFFIYTMPRSGSAWLSQFLSQPGSFCFHEPFADDMRWDWLMTRMQERPEAVVGAIDTSAYMRSDFFSHAQVPTFCLYRPLSSIIASVKKKFPEYSYKTESEYEVFQAKTLGMKLIHQRGFSDLGYLESVWNLVVGLPFDRGRSEYLMEMHVERDPSAVRRRAGLG